MKIVLTGASGGIGRSLMQTLGAVHEMIGVVRTPRPDSGGQHFVPYADKPLLEQTLADADCVIHCALDAKARGRAFLPVNRAMNAEILAGALKGKCRLYVFVSSQVVYSGTDPASPAGYREDQELILTPREDDYTRLKIESEREVIAACTRAGVDYLIVRPTIVTGPGMAWSEAVVDASKWITLGIRGRTMNLVQVDDLSRQLQLLIETGPRNSAFNIGTLNSPTEAYFDQVGRLTGHKPLFLPDWLMRLAGRFMPSTLWFFARDVAIDTGKLFEATGFKPDRPLAGYFARRPAYAVPATLEALRGHMASPYPFRAQGRGYHLWFNPGHQDDSVSMTAYAGIVALEGGTVRVKSGTRLTDVCEYLDARDLQLPTVPEFLAVTAGACFFVDIHGPGRDYFSLYDLIEEIRYLDEDGTEIVSRRDPELWAELRERRSRFILTEISFRVEPAGWLSNRVGWESEDELESYVDGRYRDDYAITIQWYARHHRLMVYHINHVAGPLPGAAPAVAPFRGIPYHMQRILLALRLRGRRLQVDRAYRILATWRHLWFEGLIRRFILAKGGAWRDMEMCMTLEDGRAFIAELHRLLRRGEFREIDNIGIRFSRDRESGTDYVWCEFVSDDPKHIDRIVAMARLLAHDGVHFHRGKYVPR